MGDQKRKKSLRKKPAKRVHKHIHEDGPFSVSPEEIQDLYNHAPCGYHSLDKDGVFIRINDTELQWLGYTRPELIGKMNISTLLTAGSLKIFQENYPRLKASGAVRDLRFDLICKDGTILPTLVSATAVYDRNGEYVMSRAVVYDITEQKQLYEVLQRNEQKLHAIIDAVPIPLFFKNVEGVFLNCNQAYADFWGFQREKIIGATVYDIAPPELAEIYTRADRELIEQRGTQVYEAQVRHADQSLHTVTLYRSALEDARKELLGIVGAMIDITKTKEIEKKLREMSLTDELTGLNNRRGFFMLAAQQIKSAARFNQGAALLYADLDNMKWINDNLGHTEGDRAIANFAALFKGSFRASDIVARLGGDEFVGLALESEDSTAEQIMARLQENLTARNIQEGRSYQLALSMGVVRWDPKNPCSLDELLERGDKLMYEQKLLRRSAQNP